jgi:hypothetical protein
MGVTSVIASIALFVILIAAWLLEGRGNTDAEDAVVELARDADTAVVAAIANASRANRIVMLSDIHESAATKRLAARALERIVATSGLDILALEVGSDLQPVIDRYLDSNPEDASVLVSNDRALRGPGPASRDYLDVYRTVWKLNEKLGADQRIQILAADLEGWPPGRSVAPAELARGSAEREQHMQQQIQQAMALNPGARVLVFMTGYHALKSGTGVLQTGGSEPVQISWLGARLQQAAPEEVYSFLVDAPVAGRSTDVTAYGGTSIADIVQHGGVTRSFVTPVTAEFDAIRRPLITRKSPGLSFELMPRDYRLSDLADAYIYLR